jgi:hypothetical protein
VVRLVEPPRQVERLEVLVKSQPQEGVRRRIAERVLATGKVLQIAGFGTSAAHHRGLVWTVEVTEMVHMGFVAPGDLGRMIVVEVEQYLACSEERLVVSRLEERTGWGHPNFAPQHTDSGLMSLEPVEGCMVTGHEVWAATSCSDQVEVRLLTVVHRRYQQQSSGAQLTLVHLPEEMSPVEERHRLSVAEVQGMPAVVNP